MVLAWTFRISLFLHLQGLLILFFLRLSVLFHTVELTLFMHLKVGLLDEEKILPLGKDITVVGTCELSNGTPEIKSCKDLPVFMYRVHILYLVYCTN